MAKQKRREVARDGRAGYLISSKESRRGGKKSFKGKKKQKQKKGK